MIGSAGGRGNQPQGVGVSTIPVRISEAVRYKKPPATLSLVSAPLT